MSEQDTNKQVIDCGIVVPGFSRVPKFDICEWVTRTAEEIADLRAKLARQAEVTGELELRCKGLESERDELKAFADRLRGAVIKGNDLTLFGADYVPADACYAALRAADAIARNLRDEVNQLRKVVQTQADSFAKLERELAMAKEEQQ
jgi:septal ring factor EnvC (AmiA/AmiB activator)